MCNMEAFTQHYLSNLSPEEFFDVVYEEWLCCKLDLGPTYESCIQKLDHIRKHFDTYSPSKKADLSYTLKEIATQFKHLDLETNYFDKKILKQEFQRLTKDLVQRNQILTEELDASMIAQKKMESTLSELQDKVELLKMSLKFHIQNPTNEVYKYSNT